MGKLHELIAVEGDRRKTAQRIAAETNSTFTKRPQHFVGMIKKFESTVSEGETFDDEVSEIVTSVPEKLDYFQQSAIKAFDVILQKEKTNAKAAADVIIKVEDGEDIVIAQQVPVQALVQLENHLQQLRDVVYNTIPTLDPKNNWIPDVQRGDGYYRTTEFKKRKTKKEQSFMVVCEGTEHNKPEIREVVKDVQTGNWVETHFSGMMSPADKSEMLSRIGVMIEAIKKARARANQIDVEPGRIGLKIFDYIKG